MNETLWEWESEDKQYEAKVYRLKPFVGELVVRRYTGEVKDSCRVFEALGQQEVAVTMDHRFGPDHQDLRNWEVEARRVCGLPGAEKAIEAEEG